MKKILLMIGVVGCFAAASDVCPDLSKETIGKSELEFADATIKRLKTSMPVVHKIYTDTLEKYNNTTDTTKYVSITTLRDFSQTIFFGEMLRAESLNNMERYQKVLASVNKDDPKWCMKDSY